MRAAQRRTRPQVRLTITTETDATGRVRGWLYDPKLKELRTADGLNRAAVVRSLTVFGLFWLRAFSKSGQVVDGGDL